MQAASGLSAIEPNSEANNWSKSPTDRFSQNQIKVESYNLTKFQTISPQKGQLPQIQGQGPNNGTQLITGESQLQPQPLSQGFEDDGQLNKGGSRKYRHNQVRYNSIDEGTKGTNNIGQKCNY